MDLLLSIGVRRKFQLEKSRLVECKSRVSRVRTQFPAIPRPFALYGPDGWRADLRAMALRPVCGEGAAMLSVKRSLHQQLCVDFKRFGDRRCFRPLFFPSHAGFLRHLEGVRDFYVRGNSGHLESELKLLEQGIEQMHERLDRPQSRIV